MAYPSYAALRWFRWLVGIGLVANLLFIVPGLFAPRYLESLYAFGVTITVLYIPVIRDPFRYLFVTFTVVVGRFAAGALFLLGVAFMDYPSGMAVLGSVDVVLSSLQGFALYRMLGDGDPRAAW